MTDSTKRLDAFTDAAFAFAVTLMVVGGGAGPVDYPALLAAIGAIPSFLIGFAIIGMFWFAHVRWRRYRREDNVRSVLLTFVLIFCVLVYVQPLRAMSASFAAFLTRTPDSFGGSIGELFFIYGIGFVAMATTTVMLFADALGFPGLTAVERREVRGQIAIWSILVTTGLVSIALTRFEATEFVAPTVYATLPLTIGLFASRYDWRGDSS